MIFKIPVLVLVASCLLGILGDRPPECLANESSAGETAVVFPDGETVELGLQKAVLTVLENNADAVVKYLDTQTAKERVKVEQGVFEPVFRTSLDWRGDRYPNTTEDAIVREGEDYSEDALLFGVGIGGLISTGAEWNLELTDKKRNSSTIEKFRDYENEYTNSARLSLRQPLLRDFGKNATYAKIRAAEIDGDIERKKFEQALMNLIGATIRQYWKLYGAQEIHRSWIESVKISEETLQNFQIRAREGKVPETALMEVQCAIGLRKAESAGALSKIVEARNQLLTLMNVSTADRPNLELIATDRPDLDRVAQPDPERYVALALENWPEYLAAKKTVEKETINVAYAKNQLLPRLDLVGRAGYNSLDSERDESLEELWDGDYFSWSAGINVEIPIFGNDSAQSNLSISRIRAKQAALELKAMETAMENAVASRIDTVNLYYNQYLEFEKAYDLKSRLVEIERIKLRRGYSDIGYILDREEDGIEYYRRLLNAAVNYKLAEAELEIASGMAFEKYGVNPDKIIDN